MTGFFNGDLTKLFLLLQLLRKRAITISAPDNVVRNVSDHRGQDARNAGSSGPSSNENNTRIISVVLTLPLTSLSMTRSC